MNKSLPSAWVFFWGGRLWENWKIQTFSFRFPIPKKERPVSLSFLTAMTGDACFTQIQFIAIHSASWRAFSNLIQLGLSWHLVGAYRNHPEKWQANPRQGLRRQLWLNCHRAICHAGLFWIIVKWWSTLFGRLLCVALNSALPPSIIMALPWGKQPQSN